MSDRSIPAGLNLSDSQRQAILYLEALGLIHDLGKLTANFLRSKANDSSKDDQKYDYRLFVDPRKVYGKTTTCKTVKNWLDNAKKKTCAFHDCPSLTDTLLSMTLKAWDDTEYSLAELAPFLSRTNDWEKNDQWNRDLGKNMQPGTLIGFLHGIAHFDKEASGCHKAQPYANTWRSTPFGYDVESLAAGSEENLTSVLQKLPLSLGEIREIAQTAKKRAEWLDLMERGLRQGLADTSRPVNDVTLWDWGYLVASLSKAAAHYIFHHGWPLSLEELPFRTLRINLDRLRLYADNDTITDLLGKENAINEAYRKVRHFIEFDLALGNRIHHDETGDYYLIPGNLPGEDPTTALRNAIQNIFSEESLEECLPRVHFGTCVQAGNLDKKKMKGASHDSNPVIKTIAQLLINPRYDADSEAQAPVQFDNNLFLFEDEWGTGKPENAERCRVCGTRPVGYPIEKSNPEKEQNLNPWAQERKAKERHLCRICLNRRGRRAKKWANEWDQHQIHQRPTTIWTDEVADDNGRIALFVGCFKLDHWLDGSALSTTRMSEKTEKNPSPARLFRIAETARSFWQAINKEVLPEIVTTESPRFILRPVNPERFDLGHYHTYEVKSNGIRISVVWDHEHGNFISVENLNGLMRRHGYKQDMVSMMNTLKKAFEDKECHLYHPSSYGKASSSISALRIGAVCLSTGYYKPVIPLLAEPGICMNLMPADKALDVALNVFKKYQKEMNRVQDRMPMGIGLVFFPRRTPLRTVMEAGRSMLDMLGTNPIESRVIAKNEIDDHNVDLSFDKKGISFSYNSVDLWHGWCFDSNGVTRQINMLKEDDLLKIYPGRFDFEFLDTSGRRFDIHYNEHGKRPRNTRPFYLTEIQHIKDLWQQFGALSRSQIQQVIASIETKRTEWRIKPDSEGKYTDDVFEQFVFRTLANAEWPKRHPWHTSTEQNAMVQAGVDGILTDIAELYLSILKSPSTENLKA